MNRKLIEVALPIAAIDAAVAHERARRRHHARLHPWWARRPVAACRAVLLAQRLDDPSAQPDRFPTAEDQRRERARLLRLVADVAAWYDPADDHILAEARAELRKNAEGDPAPVIDPFCGSGSIPLEAVRLGLPAHASDLNPVATILTKAIAEIPGKNNGPAVHPEANRALRGPAALAEDVRLYGAWFLREAETILAPLYPLVRLDSTDSRAATAWLWARTVTCPVCGCEVPLLRSHWLSSRRGREFWLDPRTLDVRTGPRPPADQDLDGTLRRGTATCSSCGSVITNDHLRAEGVARRLGVRLLTMVAQSASGRVYLPPTGEQIEAARNARPSEAQELAPVGARYPSRYGLDTFEDLFTPRQRVALERLSSLVQAVHKKVLEEATRHSLDGRGRAEAISTYLALSVSSLADKSSALCEWDPRLETARAALSVPRVRMVWSFAEIHPLEGHALEARIRHTVEFLEHAPANAPVSVSCDDARTIKKSGAIVTDLPWYDLIGYAELSNFFHPWLRRGLKDVFPQLLASSTSPREGELVADSNRFDGDVEAARAYFTDSLEQVLREMRRAQDPGYPLAIFTFRREGEDDFDPTGGGSWAGLLERLVASGLQITATWPIERERLSRLTSMQSSAKEGRRAQSLPLKSASILVVARKRETDEVCSVQEALDQVRRELVSALRAMRDAGLEPNETMLGAIGSGLSVLTGYAAVLRATGSAVSVREGLSLIQQLLDEIEVPTATMAAQASNEADVSAARQAAARLAGALATRVSAPRGADLSQLVSAFLERRRGDSIAHMLQLARAAWTDLVEKPKVPSKLLWTFDSAREALEAESADFAFIGREAYKARIDRALEQGRSIVLVGQRRSGRTALLDYAAANARRRGGRTEWINATAMDAGVKAGLEEASGAGLVLLDDLEGHLIGDPKILVQAVLAAGKEAPVFIGATPCGLGALREGGLSPDVEVLHLTPTTPSATRELVGRSSGLAPNSLEVEELARISGGWPSIASHLGRALAMNRSASPVEVALGVARSYAEENSESIRAEAYKSESFDQATERPTLTLLLLRRGHRIEWASPIARAQNALENEDEGTARGILAAAPALRDDGAELAAVLAHLGSKALEDLAREFAPTEEAGEANAARLAEELLLHHGDPTEALEQQLGLPELRAIARDLGLEPVPPARELAARILDRVGERGHAS